MSYISSVTRLRFGGKSVRTMLVFILGLNVLHAELPTIEGTMTEDYLPGLKSILAAALKQAPQMVLSEINLVQQAEYARIGAQAAMLPSLSGSGSYSIGQSAPGSNPSAKSQSQGFYYSLGISQSVFQFGAVKNQVEIAKIAELISHKNHAEAYRLFAANLRLQYVALIVQKASLSSVTHRQKIAEALLKVEEEKLRNGTISPGDLLGSQLSFEEARLAVARAEQDYASALRIFAHLVGMPAIEDSEIPAEIPKPTYSAEAAASIMALLRRDNAETTNAVQVAAFYVRQADLSYQITKVRLLPKFSAGASTTLSNSTSVSFGVISQDTVSSQSAGITGTWSIFDGFATGAAKKGALASKRAAEKSLQNQIQLTLDNAESMQKNLALTVQGLALVERRGELAEAAMNKMKDEFQKGNVSQAVVDEATYGFYIYQAAVARARGELLNKWADYISLVGLDPAMNNLPARYAH